MWRKPADNARVRRIFGSPLDFCRGLPQINMQGERADVHQALVYAVDRQLAPWRQQARRRACPVDKEPRADLTRSATPVGSTNRAPQMRSPVFRFCAPSARARHRLRIAHGWASPWRGALASRGLRAVPLWPCGELCRRHASCGVRAHEGKRNESERGVTVDGDFEQRRMIAVSVWVPEQQREPAVTRLAWRPAVVQVHPHTPIRGASRRMVSAAGIPQVLCSRVENRGEHMFRVMKPSCLPARR